MPFTLAHPAIIIPLSNSRFKLSLTGLIVGSMIPDFEFFLQMREVENIGHHANGILLFDLPVALMMTFLFHNVLRDTLIASLPLFCRDRFIAWQHFNWNVYVRNNKVRLVCSILIGVLSHQGLDAITHHDGLVVRLIPALSSNLHFMAYSIPVFYVLQIIFSIIGLILVYLQVVRLSRTGAALTTKIDYRYWTIFGVLFFAILSIRLFVFPQYNSFGGIAIAIMGALFYSWLPTTLILNLKNTTYEHKY